MRLIDADALGNRMYHESFEKDSDLQRWDSGCWIRYKLFEQVLRAAPTIEPQKWIPCTPETMPEEAGAYLCTCNDAGRLIITLIKWQPRMKSWNLTGARTYWKVIAWMPLPEPWGGDSDG